MRPFIAVLLLTFLLVPWTAAAKPKKWDVPCQRVFVTGIQVHEIDWALRGERLKNNLYRYACQEPVAKASQASAILGLEWDPKFNPAELSREEQGMFKQRQGELNSPGYLVTCSSTLKRGAFRMYHGSCKNPTALLSVVAAPTPAPVAEAQAHPQAANPVAQSANPSVPATHPRPVMGLWAGMSVEEFMRVEAGRHPAKQAKTQCGDCLDVVADALPVPYRDFKNVLANFYQGKLVAFFVLETVPTGDDGNDARDEANGIAADIEKRYGKPTSTTRECSAAGYTYGTVGKFWMVELAQGNINWDDWWDFSQPLSKGVSSPANDAAMQARLISIDLSISRTTDDYGTPRLNHAEVDLLFTFQGNDKLEAAVKKARQSVL